MICSVKCPVITVPIAGACVNEIAASAVQLSEVIASLVKSAKAYSQVASTSNT